MAINLASLGGEPLPLGVEIQEVDESLLPLWGRVCRESFEFPAGTAGPLADWMRPFVMPGSPVHAYLAYLDGEPVATSASLDAGGVTGLYFIGTLRPARGRGIGRAITLRPLLDAQERGLRTGILQASSMGVPVYRGLGFEQYIEIREYLWEPDVRRDTR
jgi:hypothetical protein